jgi:hypothetical protein
MTKFGFPEAEWEDAKARAKKILAGYAARTQVVSYTDFLAELDFGHFEPHDPRFHELLGEISREEARAGRGMLSALVVHKRGDYKPGPGFFKFAREIGHAFDDGDKFWLEQIRVIFSSWAK